jgi:hypothetical protein
MKKMYALIALNLLLAITVSAQDKKTKRFTSMYFQWGYNTEWYTRSTIHFRMNNGDNFKLNHIRAHDRRDYDAILKKPLEVSIPQYNYRIGFYLNRKHTHALEINFDHAKYIVTDGQRAHVTGKIGGVAVDGDSILNPQTFLHLEHTDGANWLHINYVTQHVLMNTKSGSRPLFTSIWKAGAGINIPRTDFTWHGDRLNNDFHIAGFNVSAEGGARVYPGKKLFLELTGKSGYVQYIDALANTHSTKGNRVSHHFGYFEIIGTIGFDINW